MSQIKWFACFSLNLTLMSNMINKLCATLGLLYCQFENWYYIRLGYGWLA